MFSARLLVRAAPRITTRSITTVTRRAFPIRQLAIPRYFTTSRPQFDASSQELAAKLESELSLEGGENPQLSEDQVSDFLATGGWQLTDNEGEQIVKLSRKHEDELITVQFTVADFPPPYDQDEMDDALLDEEDMDVQSGGGNSKAASAQGRTAGGNIKVGQNDKVAPGAREELLDEEDEQSGQSFAASVSVTVSRTGKKDALRFELVAEDGEISIQSITPLPASEAESVPGYPGAEKYWAGPPFEQLDEELQSFFENYLTERGIDSRLAIFVPDYIDTKEQKEYLSWLSNVKTFLD